MAGSHKERIEFLESKFETLETGVAKIAQLEEKVDRVLRRRSKKMSSSSSSSESSASDSGSDDIQLMRDDDNKVLVRKNDSGRGRPKLSCPIFNGGDPISWLSRIDQYFDLNEIKKNDKVRYAAYYLEGEANIWWQWLSRVYRKKGRLIRWKDFQKELMARFGPSDYKDYDEALTRIKQTGSLREYQKEFERLASRVIDWPEKALVGAFMGGLKPELAAEVRVHRPKKYSEAIELARLQDDHLSAKRVRPPEFRRTGTSSLDNKGGSTMIEGEQVKPTSKNIPPGVRRLPWDELQKRREKGLCFNCDEKFVPGHRCKIKQAFLIEPTDSGDEGGQSDTVTSEEAEISVHALAGIKGPRTMRLKSWIKGRRVMVLIDSGSTHNFINQEIAKRLNLEPSAMEPFSVRVASGEKLSCKEMYKQIPIQIQGVTLMADLFSLPLGGIDVVLGIQWLESLGQVITDYKAGTMEFTWGDGRVTLRTQDSGQIREVNLDAIERIVRQGGTCYAVKIEEISLANEGETGNNPMEIKQILMKFPTVLQEPNGLPPKREFDHNIPLMDETRPVNVHPYRYAHFQKEEIERQVQEMLANGLIRPSSSPFSSQYY